MLLSIVIPCFNVEKYLKRCVESVLKQIAEDDEIILVDDGSTDSTPNICDAYRKNYPFIKVLHKRNQGLLLARKDGIELASGQYIINLDSDDYLYDNAIRYVKKAILEFSCPDIIVFDYLFSKDNKTSLMKYPKFSGLLGAKEIKELKHYLLSTNKYNSVCTKVSKRTLYTFVDYKSDNKNMSEDIIQTLFLVDKAKTICFSHNIMYVYCFTSGSIVHNGYSLANWRAKYCSSVLERRLSFFDTWFQKETAIKNEIISNDIDFLLNIFNIFFIYKNEDFPDIFDSGLISEIKDRCAYCKRFKKLKLFKKIELNLIYNGNLRGLNVFKKIFRRLKRIK